MQNINVGLTANNGLGDPLRDAMIIVNDNFAELQGLIDAGATQIELDAAIATLNASISDIYSILDTKSDIGHTHIIANITGLQDALNALVSSTTFNNAISNINLVLTQINLDIDAIENNITNIGASISNIYSNITSIENNIDVIEGDITNIQGDITQINTDINNIGASISNIYSNIDIIEGDITDLQNTDVSLQNQIDDLDDRLVKKQNLPTGYIIGMTLSINVDNTKFDIGTGAYVITDFTDLTNIESEIIQITTPITGITPTGLTSSNATYVGIDLNQTIIQQSTPFDNAQRRSIAILGAVIHSNHININTTNEIKAPIIAPTNQLHDFIKSVGSLNLNGNIFSANGANLMLNKSPGQIWGLGINGGDYTDPHRLTIGAQTALTFRYRLRGGAESADTTSINVTQWDNNGVLSTISNNKFVVQHINIFQSGMVRIQYGQKEYDNMADAKTLLSTDPFVLEQNIADNAIFRAFLIVKKGITNLTTAITAEDAAFIVVDKFGSIVGSAGVSITSALIITALGYTPENVGNKATGLTGANNTTYPTTLAVQNAIDSATASIYTNILKQTVTDGVTASAPSQDAVYDFVTTAIASATASIVITPSSLQEVTNVGNTTSFGFEITNGSDNVAIHPDYIEIEMDSGSTSLYKYIDGSELYLNITDNANPIRGAGMNLDIDDFNVSVQRGIGESNSLQINDERLDIAAYERMGFDVGFGGTMSFSSTDIAFHTSGGYAYLKTDSLSSDGVFNFPNVTSGTFSMTSDLAAATASITFDKVIDNGGTVSNGSSYINIKKQDGYVTQNFKLGSTFSNRFMQSKIDPFGYYHIYKQEDLVNGLTYSTMSVNSFLTTLVSKVGSNTTSFELGSSGIVSAFTGATGGLNRLNFNNQGLAIAKGNTYSYLSVNLLTSNRNFEYADASGILPAFGTTAPAGATATGSVGEIRVTSKFVYMCIATNTWVRAAVATW